MRRTTWPLTLALVGVLFALAGAAPTPAPAADDGGGPRADGRWFTAWAESQQRLAQTPLKDQSVRSLAHLSQGGHAVRIRIQTEFGTEPLVVDRGTAALSDGQGPAVRAKSMRQLTFGGSESVAVPAGGEVWSDPVALDTAPDTDLAISLHVPGQVRPGQHDNAFRDNYLTAPGSGDHVQDVDGSAYTATTSATYLVSAVDVRNPNLRGTIVAYGSSVVDGTGSTDCGQGCTQAGNNRRWSDDLARRITRELPATRQLAVANAGIAGTFSSTQCPDEPKDMAGLEAGPRLDRDVLALHGVTGVIFFYGTNDLQGHCTSAQILASYREVFAGLHEHGIKVYVVPSTPRPLYTDQMNRYRWDIGTFVTNRNN
jgi:lysophospholipase L1-like esterase